MTNQIASTNDFDQIINRADLADSTKYQYCKAIKLALENGVNLTNPDDLGDYAQGLKKSSRAFLKSALRLWSKQVELKAKGGATPDNVNAVTATVYRIEALNEAITVKGNTDDTTAKIWLSQADVKKLSDYCKDNTLICQRNRIVLGLLVGAGLRRAELASLTFDDIKTQPTKGKIRTVIQVKGKGSKTRVIPLNDNLTKELGQWAAVCGNQGFIARAVSKGDELGDRISPQGIFDIVNKAGKAIGYDDLAPHSLRRTFAQIGYEAGISLTQISKLLGHASVATTQKYLNLDLDLETSISDFIPW